MSNGRKIEWWQWPLPALLLVFFKITLFKEWPQTAEFFNCLYQHIYNWFSESGDKHMYLLSAIAQTLGAIFAIVFAITPIVVQQLSRYISKPLRYVFKPLIITYVAGFAVAITIPLWCLINPGGLGSFISLVVSSGFILSLIWYFSYILKKSDIGNFVSSLKGETIDFIAEGNFKEAEDRINSLGGIIARSISYGEYKVLNQAANEHMRFALEIEEKAKKLEEGTEPKRLLFTIFEAIHVICKEAVDKPRALEQIIIKMGLVGADAIEKGLTQTEFSSAHNIRLVGTMCNNETQIQLSIQCFYSLFWMMTKHPPKAPLVDMVGRAKTMQDFYIDHMLQIYDIHLEKGWQDRLEWLLRMIVKFIPRYQPSEDISRDILVTIWLTDARFEEPNARWLHKLLESNKILEGYLNAEIFEKAIEKGRKFGILEEKLRKRWDIIHEWKEYYGDKTCRSPQPKEK